MKSSRREPYNGPYEMQKNEEYRERSSDLLEDIDDKRTIEKIAYRTLEVEKIKEIQIKTSEQALKRAIELQTDVEPLKMLSSTVIGDFFDRVRFLRERITEAKNALEDRKLIHRSIEQEIDDDVSDRKNMLAMVSDNEKARELKLDISLLRMEKRKENTNFWRDLLALRRELMELIEQYEVESKISSLFKDLK